MEEILFTKMHGIGNDYIYINCLASSPRDLADLAIEMSRPHTGVGSDGIILILPSDIADFKMRIFNADGSEARMCGNGARCIGKYVYDYALTHKTDITLETLSGIKRLELHVDGSNRVSSVTVDMGIPSFSCADIPVSYPATEMIEAPVATSAGTLAITAVSMGNPHGVIFVDNIDTPDIHSLGRELEMHPMWADRANIEFAQLTSPGNIAMRVWERGSGETMACGTGACAVAATALRTGRIHGTVTVHLLGGDLHIEHRADRHIYMTGPTATVFEGRYFRHKS